MAETIRVAGFRRCLPVSDPECLVDAELEKPVPGPGELLVRIEAVSVLPLDVRLRATADPGGALRVLGHDAAGVVAEVGAGVTRFAPGDEVYYRGTGTNAQYHLVDERVAAAKPGILTFGEAAAMPSAAISAWAALDQGARGSLLVPAATGGPGAMAVQLARALTRLTVIAVASGPEAAAWVRELGAHEVVDAPVATDHVFGPAASPSVFGPAASPSGDRGVLDRVAGLVEDCELRSIAGARFGPIDAAGLRKGHAATESPSSIGTTVVAGFC